MSLENETIDGGSYHSYDPNNVKDGRTFISKDDIELKMSQGKTAEVDSKGHMINNTHLINNTH